MRTLQALRGWKTSFTSCSNQSLMLFLWFDIAFGLKHPHGLGHCDLCLSKHLDRVLFEIFLSLRLCLLGKLAAWFERLFQINLTWNRQISNYFVLAQNTEICDSLVPTLTLKWVLLYPGLRNPGYKVPGRVSSLVAYLCHPLPLHTFNHLLLLELLGG